MNVVALRSRATFAVTAATWDQVDLNGADGSDTSSSPYRRALSAPPGPTRPSRSLSRIETQVDAFWIGSDDRLRTSWATGLGTKVNAGPSWAAALQPGGTVPARNGSSLAAAAIDGDHIEAFLVGLENEIVGHRWNQGPGWAVAQPLYPATWARPTHALTALRHDGRVHLFWSDDDGAIWTGSVNRQDVPFPAVRVARRGSIANTSPIAAISVTDGKIDLFWSSRTNTVMSTSWNRATGTWAAPFEVGGGHMADPQTGITAVQINRSGLQVFWQEPDRSVWSTF